MFIIIDQPLGYAYTIDSWFLLTLIVDSWACPLSTTCTLYQLIEILSLQSIIYIISFNLFFGILGAGTNDERLQEMLCHSERRC